MERYFNTEGLCDPKYHYMVRLDGRLRQIRERYVDRGSYFTINRGRQYGKTTILRALAEYVRPAYAVVSMDFQGIGAADFASEERFARVFAKMFVEALDADGLDGLRGSAKALYKLAEGEADAGLMKLFEELSHVCQESAKPVVLMVDGADSAANNQVFLDFLSLLRRYYLDREKLSAFHSVILAGVYDIKNLKLKLRPETEHRYNSPWNIAVRFTVDMNFSAAEIDAMLEEYEADHKTGMDTGAAAALIYEYTAGHPYLVSAVCKRLDEEISGNGDFTEAAEAWMGHGIAEAVSCILDERVPLFDSMVRHLEEYPKMKDMLRLILFQGRRVSYNPDQPAINLASMFGYVVKRDRNQFIRDGRLDMERVLQRIYGQL